MTIQLFTFDQWNSIQIAGAQNAAASVNSQQPDFSVGSVDLALVEGATGSLLFLQAAVVQVLLITRAATSEGTDLDSFFADFGFPREAATFASGVGTFSRSSTAAVIVIPCDGSATVLSQDGTLTYTVAANTALATYDIPSNTYIIPAGTASALIGLQALTSGVSANQTVGTTLLTGTNVSGIDTVVVASGFASGADAELDAAYRARFVLYLAGLARGTLAAIGSAVLDTQQGLQYTIANNQDPAGNFEPGNFVVTIDDGTGSPSDGLIAAVDASVALYAPNTVSFNIRGPSVDNLTISYTAALGSLPSGVSSASVDAQLAAATIAYVNTQRLGQTPFSLALLTAMLVSQPYVTNITNLRVNGAAVDLTVAPNQVVKLASGNLTVAN